MTGTLALLTVALPAAAAVIGLPLGRRSRPWAAYWAVFGAVAALVAAIGELVSVLRDGPRTVGLLGSVDTGGPQLHLDLRADALAATVAVAVALVATCVQIYSTAYLAGEGIPEAPTRYPAYASTVSLFTAAMLLVIHSNDLVLLLIGWEGMGICSYLLVGHHSERPAARAAAVKAFLVTRVGDLGVLLGVVVLLTGAGTTSISDLTSRAAADTLPTGSLTAAALLFLAGVAGKSAQFPLHTWLPDAMEGPTPVSALIHAATMVAAGVFLVARLLPLYLAVPAALGVAAVIASISMLGAALAAFAQDDLKRLLAWSTISQVAYMLGGVAVAQDAGDDSAGIFHLLSHAAFKALLFLVAGCVIHVTGSTRLADMGGLLRSHPQLAWLFGLGLAGLAGVPPLGGFWSKEAVLTSADRAAHAGHWTGWLVLLSGLTTTLITGLYAGRAWSVVALSASAPAERTAEAATETRTETNRAEALPPAMIVPLWILAVPTALLGLVLIHPPGLLAAVHVDLVTGVTGSLLALAGLGWAISAPRLGAPDIAVVLPAATRLLLRDGYRLDDVQQALVVRPYQALARQVSGADRNVIDAYVRGTAIASLGAGWLLGRAQRGLATGYVAWLLIGAVLVGVAGLVLA